MDTILGAGNSLLNYVFILLVYASLVVCVKQGGVEPGARKTYVVLFFTYGIVGFVANYVLYLAGVPIDRILAWAPHPGRQLGMAVSILSYRGMASLTVIGDGHLVPDPEAITSEFNREFDKLHRRVKAA